jgi:hypothetical protein
VVDEETVAAAAAATTKERARMRIASFIVGDLSRKMVWTGETTNPAIAKS